MLILLSFVISLISAGAIFGAFLWVRKQVAASFGTEREGIIEQIGSNTTSLQDLLKFKNSYGSKGQLTSLKTKIEESSTQLQNEKNFLSQVERNLENAQKSVEEKEAAQQELKLAKEDEEDKIKGLLGAYDEVSKESIALEQRLAESLKNLDNMIATLELSEGQKEILTQLSTALTAGGESLRDLLMEYETLNERISVLRQQHTDLEEEYTKLVEQQLGD